VLGRGRYMKVQTMSTSYDSVGLEQQGNLDLNAIVLIPAVRIPELNPGLVCTIVGFTKVHSSPCFRISYIYQAGLNVLMEGRNLGESPPHYETLLTIFCGQYYGGYHEYNEVIVSIMHQRHGGQIWGSVSKSTDYKVRQLLYCKILTPASGFIREVLSVDNRQKKERKKGKIGNKKTRKETEGKRRERKGERKRSERKGEKEAKGKEKKKRKEGKGREGRKRKEDK